MTISPKGKSATTPQEKSPELVIREPLSFSQTHNPCSTQVEPWLRGGGKARAHAAATSLKGAKAVGVVKPGLAPDAGTFAFQPHVSPRSAPQRLASMK